MAEAITIKVTLDTGEINRAGQEISRKLTSALDVGVKNAKDAGRQVGNALNAGVQEGLKRVAELRQQLDQALSAERGHQQRLIELQSARHSRAEAAERAHQQRLIEIRSRASAQQASIQGRSAALPGGASGAGSGGISALNNLDLSAITGQLGGVSSELATFAGVAGVSAVAVGGLAVALGGLTLRLADASAELKLTSQITGLSVQQLQLYQNAAQVAGVGVNTLAEGVSKFRQKAQEALAGNFELANSFAKLGLDAQQAVVAPAQSFERFLDQLQRIPDPLARVSVAQRILGDDSKELTRAIIALTGGQGELRSQLQQTGVALDDQAVNSLAKLDRQYELVSIRVQNFAKNQLVNLYALLTTGGPAVKNNVTYMQQFGDAQQRAQAATSANTGAIKSQIGAINELTRILPGVRISTTQKAVSEAIAEIAVQARTTQEGVQTFYRKVATDDNFRKTVTDNIRYTEILKAVNAAAAPDETRVARTRAARAVELSDLQKLQKQLTDTTKELMNFQAIGSQEFQLKIKLEDARALKNDLEEIFKLRRSLGEAVAAPFPETAAGAEREIERLKALKEAREGLAKLAADPLGPVADVVRAQTAAFGEQIATLDKLVTDALPKTSAATIEQALALSKEYQALLKTNPQLAEYYLQQARGADATIRANNATEAFTALQGQLNSQLQSQQNLTVEQATALKLQTEAYKNLTDEQRNQLLTTARQIDAQALFRNQVDAARRATEQFANGLQSLFDTLFERGPKAFFDQLLSTLKRTLARMASEILTSSVLRLLGFGGGGTGGSASGGGIGGLFGSIFGGLFGGSRAAGGFGGFGTPPFNPNAGIGAPSAISAITGIAGAIIPGFPAGGATPPIAGGASRVPAIGSIFGNLSGLFRGFGFNAANGSAGPLAQIAPLLGLSLGSSLGTDTLTRILGGAGGALLGIGVTAVPAILSGATAGLGGAIAGLFSNPFTAIAGAGLLVGSFLLGRARQRRRDESTSGDFLQQAIDSIRDLRRQIRTDQIDGRQARDLFEREILATFQQQIGTLRTRSVRESRLTNQVRDLRQLFETEVVPEIAAQRRRRETGQRLVPEFAFGGFVPGYPTGRDSVLAMLSPREMVLTVRHQQQLMAMAGADVFQRIGVPGAPAAQPDGVPAFRFGGEVPFISQSAPVINISLEVANEVTVGDEAASRIFVTGARTSGGRAVIVRTHREARLNREL